MEGSHSQKTGTVVPHGSKISFKALLAAHSSVSVRFRPQSDIQMRWTHWQTDPEHATSPHKTNQITPLYPEAEEEGGEYPHQGEDFYHEVGDPTLRISLATSVVNKGISLATALSTAGISPAVARRALHKRMTTMNKKNPSKWHGP